MQTEATEAMHFSQESISALASLSYLCFRVKHFSPQPLQAVSLPQKIPRTFFFNLIFFFVFLRFLGPLLQHIEVPRLGVQSEVQPPAYTRATATRDPSRVCNLHHSSQQHWILNPLREARDRTCNLMVLRLVNHCATTGTPPLTFLSRSHCTGFHVYFLV